MRHLSLLLTICLLFACSVMQAQKTFVFSDNVKETYQKAYQLNADGRYAAAYETILKAEKLLEREMKNKGVALADLSDAAVERLYFPLYRTSAEVAYKLGLYAEMQRCSQVLQQVVEERCVGADKEADRRYKQAVIAKINGGVSFLKGEYTQAAEEYVKALSLWEYDEELTLTLLSELAQLYYKIELYPYALKFLEMALENYRQGTHASRLISDETYRQLTSQRALCLARVGRFSEAHLAIDSIFLTGEAESYRKKAKIMMLEYEATDVFPTKAKRLYQDYLKLSREYIDNNFVSMDASQREQYWLAEQPFVTDCYRLAENAPELSYDVALFSKAVLLQLGRIFKPQMTIAQKKSALSAIRVTWRDVKQKLPNSAVAIEFIFYEKANTERLAALVIDKKSQKPQFIDIADVEGILNRRVMDYYTVGELLFGTDNYDKDLLYDEEGLDTLIWTEKLQKAIGTNKNIYFAPDGILHQLAVEYMLPESLAGKNVYRLTSTRILTEKKTKLRTDNMFICGGIDYTAGETSNTSMQNDAQAYSTMKQLNMLVEYLSGSKDECDSIYSLRNCAADKSLVADEATEDVVRKLMQEYSIVHLATHGYFADRGNTGTDLQPMQTDEQLSKSCLFLSASNRNIKDETFDAQRMDGILSAREISAMDLSRNHLTVLSACQTGLGYLTVDGVFGLQRGLKTAGAKAIIVSLWDVGDLATSVFFQKFYSVLKKGKSLNAAFAEAREYLKTASVTVYRRRAGLRSLKTERTFKEPRYTNAFILIDGN